MESIGAAKFKEQCLSLLDRLGPDGLVITKHGKPVAVLIPYSGSSARLLGCLEHRIRFHGDVMSTGERWDAQS